MCEYWGGSFTLNFMLLYFFFSFIFIERHVFDQYGADQSHIVPKSFPGISFGNVTDSILRRWREELRLCILILPVSSGQDFGGKEWKLLFASPKVPSRKCFLPCLLPALFYVCRCQNN